MARVRMVTRTVTSVNATIMTVNTTTGETGFISYTVTGSDDIENEDILKKAKKSLETETLKLVYVTATTTATQLYGMEETDFLKYAKKLPPRTTTATE